MSYSIFLKHPRAYYGTDPVSLCILPSYISRVHAAHPDGLDCPIVGDDIYGKREERLCLHAGYLELTHPVTHQRMEFTADAPF